MTVRKALYLSHNIFYCLISRSLLDHQSVVKMNSFFLFVFILAEIIAFVLSVFGNLIVCYVIFKDKKLLNRSTKYILSVSIADFLVGLIVVPVGTLRVRSEFYIKNIFPKDRNYPNFQTIGELPHNFRACWILASIASVIYTTSLTALIAIALDRFWAICFPISHRIHSTDKIIYAIIACSWIFPMINGVFQLNDSNAELRFKGKCIATVVLSQNVMNLAMFTISGACVIMGILYSCIFFKIALHVR